MSNVKYKITQIQNYKLPICAIYFEKLGVQWFQLWHSHVTYTKGVAWTFVCQHSYFCSGLTAKDVLNSCSESTRIIYNVIQFAETDRRECCKAFYCILEVLTIRPVAIKRFPEHCWMTSLRTSSNYLSFSIEIWSVINMSFSRRATTDQGGPAGDSEL